MRTATTVALGLAIVSMLGCGGTSTNPNDRVVDTTTSASWSVAFTPGLDPSACGLTVNLGFSGQTINVDKASSAFHDVWSPTTPNLMKADGTLTSSGLTATLTCISTSGTGSMTGTPNGAEYAGTATLSGKTVAIRVTKVTF